MHSHRECDANTKVSRDTDRFDRYSRIDLARVCVRRARTPTDFDLVARLREAGFARGTQSTHQSAWLDEMDQMPGVFSLLSYNGDQQPVGTMRVQDERSAPLELRNLVPLDRLLPANDRPAAQFARLSVIKSMDSTAAMFALFKAAWGWCYDAGIVTMVLATPPWSKPIYDFMLFQPLGPEAEFAHAFAGGAQHTVMKLSVRDVESIWRRGHNPLSDEFFSKDHPNLSI